jgi:hypothetical protein
MARDLLMLVSQATPGPAQYAKGCTPWKNWGVHPDIPMTSAPLSTSFYLIRHLDIIWNQR